jgi:hypothetical protein
MRTQSNDVDWPRKAVELYNGRLQVRRCTTCQTYNHTGTRCSNPGTVQTIITDNCPTAKQSPFSCANCKQGHLAWHPACSIYQDEKRRVETARNSLPEFWPMANPQCSLPNPGALNHLVPAQTQTPFPPSSSLRTGYPGQGLPWNIPRSKTRIPSPNSPFGYGLCAIVIEALVGPR